MSGASTTPGKLIAAAGGPGAVIGIGASILGGIFGAGAARRQQRAAAKEVKRLTNKLESLENNRQEIIDPYAGITNLSGMITDRSDMMSNSYANLSVATKAAEMKIEEADIALANTLDTLRATGSGAGGATALAQAALQSKKEVAASIEDQEVNNEKLRAQGEDNLEQRRIAEKQRVEGVQLSQAEKVQTAEAQGKAFVFSQKENRETQQLDRTAAQLDNAIQAQAQAAQAGSSALTGALGGIASAFSDRRLKKNIKLIGKSPSGLNIYMFEYINKVLGDGIFQGVMSDEIPKEAVVKSKNGYDRVDYSKLDVEFKQI
tara:strand:+ start:6512 stop:7465 length:954 start_codon:yes stop_codon:yes gene_type:complete